MKKTFRALIVILLAASGSARAAESGVVNKSGSIGAGVAFGQPIGITGKLWLSPTMAADAALGYHFNHNFDMHADYLLHTNELTPAMNGNLPLYIGLGARLLAGDDTQFGLRFPIGISYLIGSKHLEIFAEIAPVLDLSNIGADMDGVVGLRLYSF